MIDPFLFLTFIRLFIHTSVKNVLFNFINKKEKDEKESIRPLNLRRMTIIYRSLIKKKS